MSDYERIAQIIRFLEKEQFTQPSLADLGEHVRLSPHHLHRIFAKWAGVTPKDFLQCLTAKKAKELLKGGNNVLDTSIAVGLSGPSRLHDLCVSLEAATPGEIKSGGDGWKVRYGTADSPFGLFLVAESPRGICHLSFVDTSEERDCLCALKQDWPAADFRRDDRFAAQLGRRVFSKKGRKGEKINLRAVVRGTPFQVKVWRALLRIPQGSLCSYGNLASAIDQPKASRAVGSALGKNAIAYLIPCHRVIRETGVVGNYRWDPARKRAMIAWECANSN